MIVLRWTCRPLRQSKLFTNIRPALILIPDTRLPFRLPTNCALSIAVKSYLDELLSNDADPTSPQTKARVLDTASTRYFPQSVDFKGDLRTAFGLWDAVYEGIKNGGNAVPESTKKLWAETNEWLAARR